MIKIVRKIWSFSLLSLLWIPGACSQNPTDIKVENPEFEKKLNTILSYSVPLISVDDLQKYKDRYIILDTRESKEYQTSHIRNALFTGYDEPDFAVLKDLPKGQPIVVYCSVGYRSEKIGAQLKKMGFTEVYNLYGSLFEWANKGYPLVSENDTQTDTIHTFNKRWSKWVTHPAYTKIW